MVKMITAFIHVAAANEHHQPIGPSSCQAGFAECTVLVFQGIIQCQKSLCVLKPLQPIDRKHTLNAVIIFLECWVCANKSER